ncbi:MAG: hypothetical protein AB1689_19590 [Thermodesulfobacteriota bacterium]
MMLAARNGSGRRLALGLAVLAVAALGAGSAWAGDGVQFSGDCDRTYVNKQVGDTEQWAITWEIYGNATGNVFKLDGSDPSFIECILVDETETEEVFDCFGSAACAGPPCGGSQWTLIGQNIAIPLEFFFPPGVDPLNPFDQCELAE